MTSQGVAEMAYEEYCFGLYTCPLTKPPTQLKYGDAHKFWGIKELGTCCLTFEGWWETRTGKTGVCSYDQ